MAGFEAGESAWTAIPSAGPGSDDPAHAILPAALVLLNPVTDTKDGGYGGTKRFGGDAERSRSCSVPDRMTAKMSPAIIFYATADQTVPYASSVAFKDKFVRGSNHGEAGRAADVKTREAVVVFLPVWGWWTAEPPALRNELIVG